MFCTVSAKPKVVIQTVTKRILNANDLEESLLLPRYTVIAVLAISTAEIQINIESNVISIRNKMEYQTISGTWYNTRSGFPRGSATMTL